MLEHVRQEIVEFRNEVQDKENAGAEYKRSYAGALLNGIGEQMKLELSKSESEVVSTENENKPSFFKSLFKRLCLMFN